MADLCPKPNHVCFVPKLNQTNVDHVRHNPNYTQREPLQAMLLATQKCTLSIWAGREGWMTKCRDEPG